MKQDNLKISFLGGIGEIGKNMTAVEYGDDIIVMDCGLAFPTDDMPGIDVVVPDITYLLQNKHRIRGFIVTHGHEDHIGSMPYVLNQIQAPVYATRLTLALIENKLKEHKVKYKGIAVKHKSVIKLGCFTIEFLRVTHSISGALAFAITTPVGVYFHTGDFKLDLTPVNDEPMDLSRLGEIAKKGVLLLTADSTNAEREGYSMSEKNVGKALDGLFGQYKKNRIIIATFASNIQRVQQILDIAEKYGRKVTFSGRSMINVCETSAKIGELRFNKENVVDISNVDKYKDEELCILSTGSQGEPHSALSRMASNEFPKITIGENDLVIFSSSAIPGNEKGINDIINTLYKAGAEVIYDKLAEVHVSGHAYREELKVIHSILKPKFFIPVHGEYRHLRAHKQLAMSLGMPERNVLLPELGQQVVLNRNIMKVGKTIPVGSRFVDGLGVGDISTNVLRDRVQLSEEGICIVMVTISAETGAITSKPELIYRGFTFGKDDYDLQEDAKDSIINTISTVNFKTGDWSVIKNNIRKNLTSYFFRKIKRRPMVLPIIMETNNQ